MTSPPFRYEGYQADPASGRLTCRYSLGGIRFSEVVTLTADPARWDREEVRQAARLVFLLAGVSYYKTAAPAVIDLGDTAVTDTERAFLRSFYTEGLAEFAYRNGLDLSGLRIEGPSLPGTGPASLPGTGPAARPAARAGGTGRPLVPFGGGIDSIVTAEMIRERAEPALFIVSLPGTGSRPSNGPRPSPGCPSCAPSARSTRSCCVRVSWGFLMATFR